MNELDAAYLSLKLPLINAPTERNISVIVIPHDTALGSLSKAVAISVKVIDTVKKSKASHAQEKKPIPNMFHW